MAKTKYLDYLAALVAAYLVMLLLVFIFRRRHLQQTFKRMRIPGPKPHLISGHLYQTRRQPYVRFAHKLHEQYGKTCGYYLGGDPFLATKDLELIQQVFVSNSRHFYDRMPFYLNIDPVPDNLICQRGDRWRYMRKLLTPAFSNGRIRSSQFYRDTQQTVWKLERQLEASSTSQETLVPDSYDRMAAVALDVIVKTAFHMDNMISFDAKLLNSSNLNLNLKGKQIQEKKEYAQDNFLETVKRACRLGFNPLVELIFCFPFLDRYFTLLCNHLYFGRIIQLLFDRLDYLVRRPPSKCVQRESQQEPTQTNRRRIIDSLIEVLRERKITKNEFRGNAFVIVFAGFETTANALTFTLWLLAKHPEIQVKLRHLIEDSLSKISTDLNEKSTSNGHKEDHLDGELAELATGCEYLEMVINESLRLYPPVPGLSCRQASRDITLSNGLYIEKGVNVIPSVFSIHRDKSIWGDDANEFKPERFEVLDVNQLNSAMFMPFGLGPRNCIGKGAALHEMKIVIGRLVQRYSIEFVPHLTPDKLKLCSPINITLTNSEKIGLKFRKLNLKKNK